MQGDVELNTRPVTGTGSLGNAITHSYLEVFIDGGEHTLEGGPTNNSIPTVLFGNPGPLKRYDTLNGFAYSAGANPTILGAINPISCLQASNLIIDDDSFKTTATYSLSGWLGPNCKSFLHWLINTGGLTSFYPGAPPGSFGWNNQPGLSNADFGAREGCVSKGSVAVSRSFLEESRA
jgi:hypothetical protein